LIELHFSSLKTTTEGTDMSEPTKKPSFGAWMGYPALVGLFGATMASISSGSPFGFALGMGIPTALAFAAAGGVACGIARLLKR
jgi:hypothetical protein